MEVLLNNGLSNVIALAEDVFSANSEVFGRVAIKKVLKSSTEFDALLRLKHENIVSVFEVLEAEEFAFVLMEFAEFGDVYDYIVKNGLMSVENTLSVFAQIVKAVEYCHANGIAHCDIKLENILLSKNGSAKLADFGFAKSREIEAESDEFCGTLPYSAPEVIQGIEYNTRKTDMWSMGVVLYVMLFGAFPYSDVDATSMVMAQLSNTLVFPENTSQSLKYLIISMLEPCAEKRADASSVLFALNQL